jgi:flavoprotein
MSLPSIIFSYNFKGELMEENFNEMLRSAETVGELSQPCFYKDECPNYSRGNSEFPLTKGKGCGDCKDYCK